MLREAARFPMLRDGIITMPRNFPRMLSRVDAAAFLRSELNLPIRPQTLARLASEGNGPPFRRAFGRVFYPQRELLAWGRSKFSPLVTLAADARRSLTVE